MKQVVIVNDALDLAMGKLAAQVAHASLSAFLQAGEDARQNWLRSGMPKIMLKCSSASQLEELLSQAKASSLPSHLVRDAGRTMLKQGTITCLGIGPAADADINKLTADLPLL